MIKHTIIVTLTMALATAATAHTADAETRLVVVVGKGSPVISLSRAELKRVFLGEPVSPGGNRLVPFNSAPSSSERAGFDRAVLGMSPSEVGQFWVDRKVRAQAGAPRTLPSIQHVVKVVAKLPNAISYVPAAQLTPDLQPVLIDGVAHSDARYSIRAN